MSESTDRDRRRDEVSEELRAALEEAILLPLGGGYQHKQAEWRRIATEYDRALATHDRADLTEAEEHIIVEPDGTAIYPGGTTWPEDATPDRADNPLDYESEWYRKGWEAGRADALATPDRADHCSECRKSWPHDGCCHEHATPDRADLTVDALADAMWSTSIPADTMTSADWKEWASAILQALATPDRADR